MDKISAKSKTPPVKPAWVKASPYANVNRNIRQEEKAFKLF
jgi:hypothetical protein